MNLAIKTPETASFRISWIDDTPDLVETHDAAEATAAEELPAGMGRHRRAPSGQTTTALSLGCTLAQGSARHRRKIGRARKIGLAAATLGVGGALAGFIATAGVPTKVSPAMANLAMEMQPTVHDGAPSDLSMPRMTKQLPASAAPQAPAETKAAPNTAETKKDSAQTEPALQATDQMGRWIQQAQQVLKQNGYSDKQMDASIIRTVIQHESGGEPGIVNNWDSNAAAGTPSKGLMQVIDPTFKAWSLPGHGDILDPVDNIIAGVRYSIGTYGSLSNVPGVSALTSGGSYQGY